MMQELFQVSCCDLFLLAAAGFPLAKAVFLAICQLQKLSDNKSVVNFSCQAVALACTHQLLLQSDTAYPCDAVRLL